LQLALFTMQDRTCAAATARLSICVATATFLADARRLIATICHSEKRIVSKRPRRLRQLLFFNFMTKTRNKNTAKLYINIKTIKFYLQCIKAIYSAQ